jgi:hypothetical protein
MSYAIAGMAPGFIVTALWAALFFFMIRSDKPT